MARGRHVAARAANLDKIERMQQSGLLKIKTIWAEALQQQHEFIVDGVVAYTHKGPLSGPEYPPEALMAVLGLSVQALQMQVPPPRPTHQVSQQTKEYNARMRENNKARWEDNDGSKPHLSY